MAVAVLLLLHPRRPSRSGYAACPCGGGGGKVRQQHSPQDRATAREKGGFRSFSIKALAYGGFRSPADSPVGLPKSQWTKIVIVTHFYFCDCLAAFPTPCPLKGQKQGWKSSGFEKLSGFFCCCPKTIFVFHFFLSPIISSQYYFFNLTCSSLIIAKGVGVCKSAQFAEFLLQNPIFFTQRQLSLEYALLLVHGPVLKKANGCNLAYGYAYLNLIHSATLVLDFGQYLLFCCLGLSLWKQMRKKGIIESSDSSCIEQKGSLGQNNSSKQIFLSVPVLSP